MSALLLDAQIRNAYQHAESCAERAKRAKDPWEQDVWFRLERRYLVLARSLELGRRDLRSIKGAENSN